MLLRLLRFPIYTQQRSLYNFHRQNVDSRMLYLWMTCYTLLPEIWSVKSSSSCQSYYYCHFHVQNVHTHKSPCNFIARQNSHVLMTDQMNWKIFTWKVNWVLKFDDLIFYFFELKIDLMTLLQLTAMYIKQ